MTSRTQKQLPSTAYLFSSWLSKGILFCLHSYRQTSPPHIFIDLFSLKQSNLLIIITLCNESHKLMIHFCIYFLFSVLNLVWLKDKILFVLRHSLFWAVSSIDSPQLSKNFLWELKNSPLKDEFLIMHSSFKKKHSKDLWERGCSNYLEIFINKFKIPKFQQKK